MTTLLSPSWRHRARWFAGCGVVLLGASAQASASPAPAPASPAPIAVGVDNFAQAESHLYMGKMVASGSLGQFVHNREPSPIDDQKVIRMNRDTLYSSAVFDLDAGPVVIELPDAGQRFLSMQVVNEDHYVPFVVYDAGPYTLTKENVGSRYAFVAVRLLINPDEAADVAQVHALQDAITVKQQGKGVFEVPAWDTASQDKVRDALLVLGATLPNYNQAFGTPADVDPVQHLIGTATGWGGNPAKDATYLGGVPPVDDGKAVYRLVVDEVPVDGFWSISVYNAEGYFQKNPENAYTVNNLTAVKDDKGAITVQFGGCGKGVANCLPTLPGWNYTVRLYQPQASILDGSWTFPALQAVP